MRIRRSLRCIPLLLLGGCFMYVPVGPQRPVAGNELRATLTTDGTAAVTPQLGPNVLMLTGIAAAPTETELPLAVQSFRILGQGDRPFDQSIVRLDRRHIEYLEIRKLSKARTALFIGGIIAGGLLLDRALLGGGLWGGDGKPGPVDPT